MHDILVALAFVAMVACPANRRLSTAAQKSGKRHKGFRSCEFLFDSGLPRAAMYRAPSFVILASPSATLTA